MIIDSPQKLHPVALGRLFLKFFKEILSKAYPVLIALFFNIKRAQQPGLITYLTLGGLFLVFAVPSLLRYFTFRWQINRDALQINHGIFKKVVLSIPLNKIQFIEIQQPLFYQIFQSAVVVVNTSGSNTKEAEITAMSLAQAQELSKWVKQQHELSDLAPDGAATKTERQKPWAQITPLQLLGIGLLSNHLKTFFIVFGVSIYAIQQVVEVLGKEFYQNRLHELTELNVSRSGYFILALVVFLVVVILSSLLLFIRYFNYTLYKHNHNLFAQYGLFKVQSRQLALDKIQMVRTKQGPLFKAIGLKVGLVQQAKSSKNGKVDDLLTPGLPSAGLDAFILDHFGVLTDLQRLGDRRRVNYYTLRFGGLFLSLSWLLGWAVNPLFYLGCTVLPIIAVRSFILWKNETVFFNDRLLCMRRKFVYEKFIYAKPINIQSIHLKRTFFQRRRGLTDLILETSGGKMRMRFLKLEEARCLANYLLYQTESSSML